MHSYKCQTLTLVLVSVAFGHLSRENKIFWWQYENVDIPDPPNRAENRLCGEELLAQYSTVARAVGSRSRVG